MEPVIPPPVTAAPRPPATAAPGVVVRAAGPQDRAAWQPLWDGYLRFYESDVPAEVTDLTWSRLLSPTEPVGALVAVDGDGALLGFAHHVLHRSTWSPTTYCYLEDLFTAPQARGRGVGTALVTATADAARAAGATRLYWHTQGTNAAARRVYDRLGTLSGFVQYRVHLG